MASIVFDRVWKLLYEDIDVRRKRALREIFSPPKEGYIPPQAVVALRDVSFSLEGKAVILVVGELGAGKTTLARLMAGLYRPTWGQVRLKGRVRLIRYKSLSATPFMRVKDYIHLLAHVYGADVKQARDVFETIIELPDFQGWAEKRVTSLPVALQKKLNFLLSVLVDADIYLFDETFSYQWIWSDDFVCKQVKDLFGKKMVVIFSPGMIHLPYQVDKILFLKDGSLLYQGKIEGLRSLLKGNRQLNISGSNEKESAVVISDVPVLSNEVIEFESVSLSRPDGKPLELCLDAKGRESIFAGQPICVKISYRVQRAPVYISGAVDIYTDETYVMGLRQDFVLCQESGTYISEVEIPSDIFAERIYKLNIAVIAFCGSRKYKAGARNYLKFRVACNQFITGEKSMNYNSSFKEVQQRALVYPKVSWQFKKSQRDALE